MKRNKEAVKNIIQNTAAAIELINRLICQDVIVCNVCRKRNLLDGHGKEQKYYQINYK
jgi:hypothetical protein